MEYDERVLVAKLKGGDSGAFEMLIHQHLDSIYRFLYRLLPSRYDAQDVAQDVFITAWTKISSFDEEKSLKPWLFRIARNRAIDTLRKKKVIPFSYMDNEENTYSFEESVADDEPLADALFEQKELSLKLESALTSLTEVEKTIILLRFVENLTFEEIAETLEKPMNTVKSHYARGLQKMKKFLESAPK